MSTIFSAILANEVACDKLYEDAHCIVIRDIRPIAPTHLLIIPKKAIPSLAALEPDDAPLLGHLLWVAHDMAQKLSLDTGYRVVINTGPDALQSVYHLHVHLLAGRGFSWPPG